MAAYFFLQEIGYTGVARNYRTARHRGDIDLIARERNVHCSIEVKTPQAAVDRHKRREIAAVARSYQRRIPPSCQWRFDIVSVYFDPSQARPPQIEVFRDASLSAN